MKQRNPLKVDIMKQLYILRHAQALSTEPGGTDKSRRLSPKGLADAKALGAVMFKQDMRPDLALCSPATRTRETLSAVLEGVGAETPADFPEVFYNAGADAYFAGIHGASDNVASLLVVGHNPGLHMLAAQLAKDDSGSLMNRLAGGYAPATLTVLECGAESWSDIRLYENRLMGVLETTEYNAPDRPTRWM